MLNNIFIIFCTKERCHYIENNDAHHKKTCRASYFNMFKSTNFVMNKKIINLCVQ